MNHNFKIGDYAFICVSKCGNEGKLVKIIGYFDPLTETFNDYSFAESPELTLMAEGVDTFLSLVYKGEPHLGSFRHPMDPACLVKTSWGKR